MEVKVHAAQLVYQRQQLLSGSFETHPQKDGGIKLYGVDDNARVTSYLYQNGVTVGEMVNRRISLEEYYTRTITAKEAV